MRQFTVYWPLVSLPTVNTLRAMCVCMYVCVLSVDDGNRCCTENAMDCSRALFARSSPDTRLRSCSDETPIDTENLKPRSRTLPLPFGERKREREREDTGIGGSRQKARREDSSVVAVVSCTPRLLLTAYADPH